MLAQDLRVDDPEGAVRLQLRACDWFEEHGDPDRAIHLAAEAGAVDRAAELVALALPDYVLTRRRPVADLVREFGPDELRREHQLALARGWDALCSGAGEATTYWAAVAEGAMGRLTADARVAASGPLALLRAAAAFGGISEMARDAELAYRVEPPDSPWRPLACYLEGTAAALMGDPDHARARLREAEQLAAIGAPALRPPILAELSQLAGTDDDPERSRELAEAADALMYEHGLEGATAAAIVAALSARGLARDGNEAKARDRLGRAAAELAAPGWMPNWMRAETQIVLAQAHLQLGDAPPGASGTTGDRRGCPGRARPLSAAGISSGDSRCIPQRLDPGLGAPDDGRAQGASVPAHASLVPPDRRAALPVAPHGEDGGDLGVPEAGREQPLRCGQEGAGTRHPGVRSAPGRPDRRLRDSRAAAVVCQAQSDRSGRCAGAEHRLPLN
jgi:hypothetical protein